MEERKVAARQKLLPPSRAFLEVDMPAVFQPGSVLDMPKRPAWSFGMGKEAVLKQEEKYFLAYLESIYKAYPDHSMLSYFEHNLEVANLLLHVPHMRRSDIFLNGFFFVSLSFYNTRRGASCGACLKYPMCCC